MTKKDIGRIVSRKRKEKDISYYVINKHTKVQRKVVKAIEKADSNYTIDSLLAVCQHLGITIHTDCSN